MNKKELLKNILNAKTNSEKLEILKEECKGMKLYRYRPYKRDSQDHEIKAIKTCNIWASRPDKFDDDYEGTIIHSSKKDADNIFKCMKLINKNDAEREINEGFVGSLVNKNLGQENMKRLLNFLQNIESANRECRRNAIKKIDCKCLDELLREYRNSFAVTCFSENSPTSNNNLWKQYCSHEDGTVAGFCLEYDVEDLLNSGYICCPIFYKDCTTISDLCTEFEYHLESIFLHKDTQGYDKRKDSEKKNLISWEKQNEWRIVRDNRKQEKGLYLSNSVMPKKLYYLKNSPHIDDILDVFPGDKHRVDFDMV